jgi:hypothetical protein
MVDILKVSSDLAQLRRQVFTLRQEIEDKDEDREFMKKQIKLIELEKCMQSRVNAS